MLTASKRLLAYFLIIIPMMIVWLVDALPCYTLLHGKLKNRLDPLLDKTGLWQGDWQLFAPVPDHINTRLSVHIDYEDEPSVSWYQPDWSSMSGPQKSLWFRRMAFLDAIRLDRNSSAWKSFCCAIVRQVGSENADPRKVTLIVREQVIPAPDKFWWNVGETQNMGDERILYVWYPEKDLR